MKYRALGNTGLSVSEIGFGGEWMERHTPAECDAVARTCEEAGINILDCWMSDPAVRSSLGDALRPHRDKWIVQGHIGSTWQNGQYFRTRDVKLCEEAFEDMLRRFHTDYIDLGMIHYVDAEEDMRQILDDSPYLQYVQKLKAQGRIRHIGISTHNVKTALMAANSGIVEMMLFSINPAFDTMPASEDAGYITGEDFSGSTGGLDPERRELYRLCEEKGIGITVMKSLAGGRLLDAKRSPFGAAMTTTQCLHYCLTRPAVSSVLVGYDTPEQVREILQYETASDEEKDYAAILASAPKLAYNGQCTYCGHCKPCPVNIDIAMVNKLYDLAVLHPAVPASLREHYRALEHSAAECIGCKGCESRCPFGVSVAQRMEDTAKLFA